MRTLTQYLCKIIIGLAMLAGTAASANVTVKLQGNYTVTSGTTRITVPLTLLQAGHVYTMTAAPVSGNVTAYGDPYLWGLVYKDGSTSARVVSQSRHSPDLGERVYLRKEMLNSGENKAEFWARCETSSCYMRLTIYERAKGTFDKRTFYREGVEPGVIDGQFSLYKDFYHPTEKNGTYGLQVDYQTNRYIYLYRDDNFSTSGMNALSFWVRSSGSIDDGDLYVALTTGNHSMITNWVPLSYYVDMPQSHTWYRVLIPLSDLNPSGQSVRGLAVLSTRSGFVYFDDMEFVSETTPLLWPLQGGYPGGTLLSPFGDDWVTSCGGFIKKHAAVDVAASVGTVVRSAMTGTVKEVFTDSSHNWAQAVVVEDTSRSFTVVYWHINSWVSEGQTIERGDIVGSVANISPTTTHLHFGYRQGAYHGRYSLLGSLPQMTCGDYPDPPFPENFKDPATLNFVSW